jgi:diaminohydroxyphosphoribosylaminopyrimidine deaminase/5-amino-6-(5-phosphoribosylamino)uracil reductase
MTISADDLAHVDAALALGRRALGRVWPNPAVGCVIVRDGLVVGRGWTQDGGRPHAETEALRRAGPAARGATAYVSFEPCSHHGKTPPCADALSRAGIARVVATIEDPDPRVSGRGYAALRAAGIALETGALAAQAHEINEGFILRITRGRPLITFKTATTLDGRTATRTGESRWISGEAARARAHLLRATHDAVMVGVGTAIADDPMLNVRLPGLETKSSVRIVVDPRLRLPPTAQLVTSAREIPTWIATSVAPEDARARAYREAGCALVPVALSPEGRVDPPAFLRALAERGLTRVMVEGGGILAASLLGAGLVDRLVIARSGKVVGGDGLPLAGPFAIARLDQTPRFRLVDTQPIGEDALESWTRAG